jgi:hypothetical protein
MHPALSLGKIQSEHLLGCLIDLIAKPPLPQLKLQCPLGFP